jgi:hypothetical protein
MTGRRGLKGASLYAAASVPVAAGSLALFFGAPAGASSLGGSATLVPPGATAGTPLHSGSSTTEFTVALPANASCSGDTANDGFHVYSYLVRRGTDLANVHFVDAPSRGYGIVNTAHVYYGAVDTAVRTGQIVGIPNDFEWAALVSSGGGAVTLAQLLYDGSTGVWETGIACANTQGTVSNDWNTEVTFSADSKDANGFAWSVAQVTGSAVAAAAAGVSVAPVPTPTSAPPAATAAGGSPAPTVVQAGGGGHSSSSPTGRPSGSAVVGTAGRSSGAEEPAVIAAVAACLLLVGGGLLLLRRTTTWRMWMMRAPGRAGR